MSAQELIRPAAAIVVRTGLFLSVMAYLAGQMFLVSGTVPMAEFILCRRGLVVVGVSGAVIGWNLNVTDEERRPVDWLFEIRPEFDRFPWYIEGRSLGGIVLHRYSGVAVVGTALSVAVPHWLLISLFIFATATMYWLQRRSARHAAGLP